jgi:hypothetical protein
MSSNRIVVVGSRLTAPSLLGDLACDFDFSNPATMERSVGGGGGNPSNGDPVGYVLDQSGNGYHIQAPSGATRPTFQTNVNGSVGAVLFDGTSEYLERATSNIAANRSALSIYAVVKHAAAPTGREPYMMASTANGIVIRMEHGASGATANRVRVGVRRANGDTLTSIEGITDIDTSMRIGTAVVNYASNTMSLHLDGVQQGTGVPPGTSGANTQGSNGKLFVGGQGAAFMNGHMFRVMMFWEAHNADQRRAVWNYLRNLYQF